MKKMILFLGLNIWMLATSFAQDIYDSVFIGNRWRTFMTHLPSGYSSSITYPLVLCFHGGQSGTQSSRLGWQAVAYMSKLSQKADAEGFIVVYPEGTVINNNRTWNAGGCCQPATGNNIDDVGFVSLLIDTLKNRYPIHSKKVFASGSSNGAMLCYRLACELSDKITAIATVSGTQEYVPCNPMRKIPIISFHSKVDAAVPYQGGIGQGPSGTDFTSQDSTLRIWTAKNECATRDTVVNGGSTGFTQIRIHNCRCSVEVHHFATTDGGHSWPGGNPNNNPVSTQIDATAQMWSFFKNLSLECDDVSGTASEGIHVYPNPSRGLFQVRFAGSNISYQVFNSLGQRLKNGVTTRYIDLSAFPSGIYFIRCISGGSFKTVAILKI